MLQTWWITIPKAWRIFLGTLVGTLFVILLLYVHGCFHESPMESVQSQTTYRNPWTKYGEIHDQVCKKFVDKAGSNTNMSLKDLKAVFKSCVDTTDEQSESLFQDVEMFAHNFRVKGLDITKPSPYIEDYPVEDCIDILPSFYVNPKERAELKLYLGTLRDELFGLPVETPADQLVLETDIAQFCQAIGTSSREFWIKGLQGGSNAPMSYAPANTIDPTVIGKDICDALGGTIFALISGGIAAAWGAAAFSIAFYCEVNGWDFNPPPTSAFWLRTEEGMIVWRLKEKY